MSTLSATLAPIALSAQNCQPLATPENRWPLPEIRPPDCWAHSRRWTTCLFWVWLVVCPITRTTRNTCDWATLWCRMSILHQPLLVVVLQWRMGKEVELLNIFMDNRNKYFLQQSRRQALRLRVQQRRRTAHLPSDQQLPSGHRPRPEIHNFDNGRNQTMGSLPARRTHASAGTHRERFHTTGCDQRQTVHEHWQ